MSGQHNKTDDKRGSRNTENEDPNVVHLDYPPLETETHSRLLKVHPGEFGDPLQLFLQQCFIADDSEPPPFEAVPYVWGDPNDLVGVSCDDKHIGITVNLFKCPQRRRNPQETRSLWVDAVCITQQDLSERSQQVSLMGKIYSKATKVLVWLGEED